MKAFYLAKNGKVEGRDVFKKTFTDMLELNIRDLRPVFSALQVSTLLPRQNSLIINLGFIKAVLTKDEVYFLQQQESKTFDTFFEVIQKDVADGKHEVFYLYVLERMLESKMSQMKGKLQAMDDGVENILAKVKSNFSERDLENLLTMKKRVSRMEFRLNEILSAVQEVLDDEENLAELIAIGDNIDKNEVESILENFLEQMEDEVGHLFRLKEEIEDTQEFVDLKLSSLRTSVVKLDLIATMATLVFALLAVIVGLYGTNIKNGLENSHSAFVVLIVVLAVVFVVSMVGAILFLKKKKIM
jgi:Mg2+ and Co2+ transporter CorA